MADPFSTHGSGLSSPAGHAAAVTPADGSDLGTTARALYIGGEGDVKVNTVSGETVTFAGLPAGTVLPVRVARVHSTDTTATSIVALW